MGIDWNKVKNNAKAKDDKQYEAMKAATATKNPVIREFLGETAKESKENQAVSNNPVTRYLTGEMAAERKEKQAQITGTIQERLNKMKNSGPAISSNVREYQDTRTEEEKRAVNQAARDRASGKVMSSLENQRRQAQVDMDMDTMNALDARMKEIRASTGKQTIADRVSDVLSTAASRTGNAIASAVGTVSNAYNDPDYNRRQIAQAQKALETGRTSDGKIVTPTMRQTLQDSIDRMNKEIADLESENSFTNRAYTVANTMRDDSRKHEESAKQGLGKAGQFAVDVGVAGAQMAGDVLASAIVPGSGLAMMGVRSFGAGAQEARDNGASIGQQMAYGVGSAALSVATEKIANVAAPFKKAFGDGILEKAIPSVIRKLSGSAAGKAALSMISEGGEEMLEDLLQPILQRATYDPEALVNYKNADYWTNMLYDGLVGAALGGVGAGVEQIGNRASGDIMTQEAQRLFGQQKNDNTGAYDKQTDATIDVDEVPIDSEEGRREFPHLNRMFDEAGVSGQAESDGPGGDTSQSKGGEKTSRAKSVYDETDNATDEQKRYDTTSDADRLNAARKRLEVDYEGEKQYLKNAAEWNGEDYAVAKIIQSDIRKQAQASGDFTEFREWSRNVQKHASAFGQNLQSMKMWTKQSADKAVGDAASVLDAAKEKESAAPVKGKARITDDVINSALGSVAEFGARAENLANASDATGLYNLVIELANYRGYKPSKNIKKALSGCTVEQLTDIAWSEIQQGKER